MVRTPIHASKEYLSCQNDDLGHVIYKMNKEMFSGEPEMTGLYFTYNGEGEVN